MAAELTHQLVMPIVMPLDERSTHASIIQDVADAVLIATKRLASPQGSDLLHGPHIDLEDWLATGMRKTTRGVKAARFAKAVLDEHSDDLRHAVHATPDVYVGTLKPYEQFTKFEKRAQVSGWDLREKAPGAAHLAETGPDGITIDVLASLSTGKAAAAAGHVATMLALAQNPGVRLNALGAVLVRLVDRIDEHSCSMVVRDAGHTEVEPGTVTAALRG